ncbi:MAG: DUF2339 domain-containing protein [Acidobacteriia bacterium]|nr:DUF2339 domain-containing protein [Terriglobia bacterium]
MADDPTSAKSLDQKLDELITRVSALEDILAQNTRRVHALEIQLGTKPESAAPATQTAPSADLARPVPTIPSPAVPSVSKPPVAAAGTSRPIISKTPFTPPISVTRNHTSENLEARLGGTWFLWVGIVAIILGVAYFLKLAFDNNWIGPGGRVVIGILFGLGFLFWGTALQKHHYPRYCQTVSGGGIAILYLSAYASFNFYHLLPAWAAFLFMIVVTVRAATLAAQYDSLVLAFFGLVGGFLTPVWLQTGEDHQIILLTYVALLVAGVAFLARRCNWAILVYTSFILAISIFMGWMSEFYSVEKRGTTEFFLCLLGALFIYIGLQLLRRIAAPERSLPIGLLVVTALLLYVASVLNLEKHSIEMFSFVALFDALILVVALHYQLPIIGLPAFLLNAASLAAWIVLEYQEHQLGTTLAFLSVIFAVFFAWPLIVEFREKREGQSSLQALSLLSGFIYFGSIYWLLNAHYHDLLGLLSVLMSAVYFLTFQRVRSRTGEPRALPQILLGIAITFVTLAIPIQLHQNWITLCWAIEAVVLTWVAIRTTSVWMQRASAILLAATVFRLLSLDSLLPVENTQLIFNKRFLSYAVVILACYGIAWLLKGSPENFRKMFWSLMRGLVIAASFLTVIMMSLEISSFYQVKQHQLWHTFEGRQDRYVLDRGEFRSLENAKQVLYSVVWGIYSVILLLIGIIKRNRDVRYFAIGLFVLTIGKVFFIDLASLERVYRVLSMIALGAILLLAAFLYQRYRKVIFQE